MEDPHVKESILASNNSWEYLPQTPNKRKQKLKPKLSIQIRVSVENLKKMQQ